MFRRRGFALGLIVSLAGYHNAKADVRVEGLADELLANARAHLSLQTEACDAPSWRVRRLVRQGGGEIRLGLQALGYYDVTVTADLTEAPDCWRAVFTVAVGKPVLVRGLRIELLGDARDDSAFAGLLAEHPIRIGSPFRHDAYENLKLALTRIAARRGYADARLLTHEVAVFPEQYAADVTLVLESGQRYAFGEVRFQQEVLDPLLVARYVSFQYGEPYDSRKLTDLYGVLAGSGYFERIQVEPLLDARSAGTIPILVTLSPGNRKAYSGGIGFSTNTGLRARVGYVNRRIDKNGHQWGASALLSSVVSEVAVNYRLPSGDPRSEWLSFDIGIKHEDTDSAVSDAFQLGVRSIRERRAGWRENRFLDLLVEDFEIGDREDRSTLVIPGISWVRSQAENRLRPDRGSRLSLEIRGSAEALGSDSNFLRFEGNAKWIRTLGASSRVILRGEIGASAADNFAELPPSVRFFVGGDASVRGYDFESLGPIDHTGAVIGGRGKLVASAEYEREFLPKWSWAVFADTGNAFDDAEFKPKTGAGLGFRWQSPVGPLRVDVAKPFDGDDRSPRLHVTFGPDL